MTRKSYFILSAVLLVVGALCIAGALTAGEAGAHCLIWGLPALAGVVDLMTSGLVFREAYQGNIGS